MKKNYTFLLVGMMALGGYTVKADNYTDITEYYLINSGFDANFNYDKSYSGNVSGNIINEVYGWDKDMTSTYTVAGTFEYGANATFNSSKTIPLLTSSCSGFLIITPIALAVSIEEPPPMAMI